VIDAKNLGFAVCKQISLQAVPGTKNCRVPEKGPGRPMRGKRSRRFAASESVAIVRSAAGSFVSAM
jgi:hypothetical protein